MTAIGWLLIMLGIGSIYEGWHGKTLWGAINQIFSNGNSLASTNNPPKTGALD